MYKRFDKMREVEKKISQLKDEKFMDLTKPVDAFITFEEEDGSIIGQYFEAQYSFSGNKLPAEQKFLGTDFYLSESTEPTNILWENRHWTPADYFKRGLIVFSIITLLILISFSIIFFCKSYSIQVFSKYPSVECPVLQKTYTSAAGKDLLAEYAQREYDAYYKVTAGLEPTPFSGALQCFCDGVKAQGLS
jgi:Calcium-dependent channel, 7TM region, putative phosphate